MDRDTATSKERLAAADDRIKWALANPRTSEWLKDALRAAISRDPLDVLNELEMLNILLKPRCQILAGPSERAKPLPADR